MNKKEEDPINPSYYTQYSIQPIDFIEAQKMNYHIGSALVYICRYKLKENPVQDLKKAIWYIEREIKKILISTEPELETQIITKYEHHTKETCPFYGCKGCTNEQPELPLKFEEQKDSSNIHHCKPERKEPTFTKIPGHSRQECLSNGCYMCITMGVESAD